MKQHVLTPDEFLITMMQIKSGACYDKRPYDEERMLFFRMAHITVIIAEGR